MSQTNGSARAIAQKVPWTRNEKLLFGTTFAAWILVNMDVALFAFTYPAMQESLGFGLGGVATIYGTVFATAALGSFAVGPLVDRLGRKPFFQLTVLFTGLGSALTAAAFSFVSLVAFRTVTSVAAASESIAAQTMMAEETHPRHRGFALGFIQSGYTLGYFLAAGIAFLLLSGIGWRGIFLIGVLPVLLVLWIRRFIPETQRYQDVHHLQEEARRKAKERTGSAEAASQEVDTAYSINKEEAVQFPLKQVFASDLRRTTFVIVIFSVFFTYANAAVQFWLPELGGARGLSLSQVQLIGAAGTGFAFFGYLSSMWIGLRLGRKEATLLFAALSVVAGYFFAFQASGFGATVLGFMAFDFFSLGLFGSFIPYVLECMPTRVRGTGMGLAQAAVWVGWFSAGVSGPALFGAMGVNATYGLWAVGFGLLATIIIAFGRHVSPNAELEDVAV